MARRNRRQFCRPEDKSPLGDGRGHLAEKQTITVQGNPVRVGLGDFSGDGILDLAVVLRSVATSTPGILAFYRGGGFGQFTLTHTISVGDPTSITIADVDLDGNPDIILSMYHENKRQLLYGNGSIVFDPPVDLDIGPNPYATAVADINGDR